jgi:putative flippase GtrA
MTILIPAYEPTLNLLRLILELKEKTCYKILVVDDGSGENYSEIFRKAEVLGCAVMHHEMNMGKGAALKTGFLRLLMDESPDTVVCADSDGQHRVDDIISVANAVNENSSDMIMGTRQFTGKVPFKSRMGNRLTSFILRLATGMDIKDTQTGLRGFPFHMLSWLRSVEGERFEYELNVLLAAKKSGIAIRQIPIATVYNNNNKGTHFRPVRDSVKVLAPIFKFCSSSIISGILDFFLLFLFQNLSGSLLAGVVSARLISSVFNYTVNKTLVFRAKNVGTLQSAPKYFGLVAVIMLLNYVLLTFLTKVLIIPDVPSKLLTELILFVMSYTVQKLYVFRRRTQNGAGLSGRRGITGRVILFQNHMQRQEKMIK